MGFMEVADLNEDYEDHPVEEGAYDLRIIKATEGLTKNGDRTMITVVIAVDGEDGVGASSIFHYICFPKSDDEDSTRRLMMQGITRFLKTFDVPMDDTGFDVEDMVGCTANNVLVKQDSRELADGTIFTSNVLSLPRV